MPGKCSKRNSVSGKNSGREPKKECEDEPKQGAEATSDGTNEAEPKKEGEDETKPDAEATCGGTSDTEPKKEGEDEPKQAVEAISDETNATEPKKEDEDRKNQAAAATSREANVAEPKKEGDDEINQDPGATSAGASGTEADSIEKGNANNDTPLASSSDGAQGSDSEKKPEDGSVANTATGDDQTDVPKWGDDDNKNVTNETPLASIYENGEELDDEKKPEDGSTVNTATGGDDDNKKVTNDALLVSGNEGVSSTNTGKDSDKKWQEIPCYENINYEESPASMPGIAGVVNTNVDPYNEETNLNSFAEPKTEDDDGTSQTIRYNPDSNYNIHRPLTLVHEEMDLSANSHTGVSIALSDETKRKLDEAAINCIILDSRSWSDFKRIGMLQFLRVAVPGYTGPASRTVQRNLSKLYKEKKEDFKNELLETSNLSITADLRKSEERRHDLCITVHWMNGDFLSKSKVLSFRKFNGHHCGKSIRTHMEQIINEFGLSGKITSTTTDNGSNIRLATTKRRIFGVRIYCLAHALNLTILNGLHLWEKKTNTEDENEDVEENILTDAHAVDKSDLEDLDDDEYSKTVNIEGYSDDDDDDELLESDDNSSTTTTTSSSSDENSVLDESLIDNYDIIRIMGKCRIIINTIQKSSILNEIILNLARSSSIKVGLVLDMRIRWNTSYKMLHRMLIYKELLQKFYEQVISIDEITAKQRERFRDAQLTESDWKIMEVLHKVLEPFYAATKLLSEHKYPTLSLAFAIIYSLGRYLKSTSLDDTQNLEDTIKKLLFESFNKQMVRDGFEAELIRATALLDPMTCELLEPEDRKSAESFLIKQAKEQAHGDSNNSHHTTYSNASKPDDVDSINPKGRESIIKSFLHKCGISTDDRNLRSNSLSIEQELVKFWSISKQEYDCASFWQSHCQTMPQLSILARKYLSISASSVPCESTFSISNHALRKNRLALTSNNTRYTMFLKDKL